MLDGKQGLDSRFFGTASEIGEGVGHTEGTDVDEHESEFHGGILL